MTITLTPEQFYLVIIALLMIVQVFQWRFIYKLKEQIDQIWTQAAILVGTFNKEIKKLEQSINEIKK